MLKKLICAVAVAAVLGAILGPCGAQAQEAMKPATNSAAIARLDAMKGVWKGQAKGFTQNGPFEVTQTERIGPMLGGDVLVIEGRGYAADGALAFNAFAIISWNNETSSYEFRAYNAGRVGTFPLKLTATGAEWEVPMAPGTKIVSTITLTDDTWHEVQAFVADRQPPRQFMEMTLKRVADTDWPVAGAIQP